MGEVAVRLGDETRRELIDHFKKRVKAPRNSGVSVYDHIDSNSSVVWKQENGKKETMSFGLFSDLFSINYLSEPRYDLEHPMKYLDYASLEDDHMNSESLFRFNGGATRLEPSSGDRDIFSYVLSHFELKELAERFGGTSEMYKNWRDQATRTVDRGIFEKAAEHVSDQYSQPPELEVDLVDRDAYRGNSLEDSIILEDLDSDFMEVLFYRQHTDDLSEVAEKMDREGISVNESPPTKIEPYIPQLMNKVIEENRESGFVNLSRFDGIQNSTVGIGLSYLEDQGVLESWGGSSNGVYMVDASEPDILDAWYRINCAR